MNKKTTDDLRILSLRQLIAPAVLIEECPLSEKAAVLVAEARDQCEAILSGRDNRLLVVVGPCSIHDIDAVREYGLKLRKLSDEVAEDVLLVMRVYFEKPRTTVGWKGLINDPFRDETYEINQGLHIARRLLIDLAEMGVPAGTEFLDTIIPQFIADAVTWGAIGARTTESQIHRELASGLSMPVGFKNGTGGNFEIALDAVLAARQPHHFLSVTKSGDAAIVSTKGNDACHLILRGGKNGPNYDAASVAQVKKALEKREMEPCIMIDCSHANSNKDYRRQPEVGAAIAEQVADGDMAIRAVMIESHLNEGNQSDAGGGESLKYGVSITDACVNWETTVEMVRALAKAVRQRRATFIA